MTPHLLAIVGLCLQILGAFFLAKSVIWKAPRFFMRELIGVPLERYRTFRQYLAGRIEAILGFLFLSVGAGFQMAGEVNRAASGEAKGLLFWIAVALLAIGAIAAALYFVVRRLAKKIFLEIFVEQVRRRQWPFQEDPELLRELGEILDLPRGEEDTVDTYQAKVRERLGLPPRRPKPRGRREV
ncbi:MAG: hypothetical protein HUU06_05250 [Planctomycetaceae bacterium]|nr:hypothetical protein [Planctomycetaceae bacterium]